ncbi:hypothetical protein NKDENANG_02795 [Candidatus Entotheonellaceae bacterium PAL068K]
MGLTARHITRGGRLQVGRLEEIELSIWCLRIGE